MFTTMELFYFFRSQIQERIESDVNREVLKEEVNALIYQLMELVVVREERYAEPADKMRSPEPEVIHVVCYRAMKHHPFVDFPLLRPDAPLQLPPLPEDDCAT